MLCRGGVAVQSPEGELQAEQGRAQLLSDDRRDWQVTNWMHYHQDHHHHHHHDNHNYLGSHQYHHHHHPPHHYHHFDYHHQSRVHCRPNIIVGATIYYISYNIINEATRAFCISAAHTLAQGWKNVQIAQKIISVFSCSVLILCLCACFSKVPTMVLT